MILSENKIIVQKIYDEAIRFMNNANKELQQANRNGEMYRDVKHLQIACGAAYLAMLKAIKGIFIIRNIPKPKKLASIEYYQEGLSKIDKKMLDSLNVAYHILHIEGYYQGFNHAPTIKTGFEKAGYLITKLKQSI